MTDHARTHLKALIDALKVQPAEQLAQPAGLFISGMLSGLAAGVQVLDGGTAEQVLQTLDDRLSAAIGRAYLNGTLPDPAPTVDTDRQLSREEEIRGAQGWMAADIHKALGRPLSNTRQYQGHASWADWWADLCAGVRSAEQRAENFEGRAAAYARRATVAADRIDDLTARRDVLRQQLAEQEAETMRQHERARQAEAAIARVRALHRSADHRGTLICVECSQYDGSTTDNSPTGYEHCPTLAALDGPPTPAATEAIEAATTLQPSLDSTEIGKRVDMAKQQIVAELGESERDVDVQH